MTHESGPIASARADLAAILREATDLPVVTNVPERLAPPCVVITEASPLLTTDDTTYNAVAVRMSLTVAVAPTTNALAIERLDEAVDTIASRLTRASRAPTGKPTSPPRLPPPSHTHWEGTRNDRHT